ncbi:hypothetical protein EYF80_015406 [Liparis tanakae]|uniref:Uncharacterized protein n=1 Tax=Liparis tanakae TaxID=230148 RepID=A0A4Z2IB15_9TELE|nr:hypothetical protein EYF80_015406 [Liparis tanakae]
MAEELIAGPTELVAAEAVIVLVAADPDLVLELGHVAVVHSSRTLPVSVAASGIGSGEDRTAAAINYSARTQRCHSHSWEACQTQKALESTVSKYPFILQMESKGTASVRNTHRPAGHHLEEKKKAFRSELSRQPTCAGGNRNLRVGTAQRPPPPPAPTYPTPSIGTAGRAAVPGRAAG